MIAVGITGSYSSGKSFVLNYLSSMQFKTFSADAFVGKLYQDKKNQNQVLDVLNLTKPFSKVKIAKLIYNNGIAREKLQNFIYPLVREAIEVFKQENRSEKIIFAEIPMLFESNFKKYFNFIVTTVCSEESRLERAKGRGFFDQKIYYKLQEIQLAPFVKMEMSDFIVNTDVNMVELEAQITKLIIKCNE